MHLSEQRERERKEGGVGREEREERGEGGAHTVHGVHHEGKQSGEEESWDPVGRGQDEVGEERGDKC